MLSGWRAVGNQGGMYTFPSGTSGTRSHELTIPMSIGTHVCSLAMAHSAVPNAMAVSITGRTATAVTLQAYTSTSSSVIPVSFLLFGK